MRPAEQDAGRSPASEPPLPGFEDLIPIAVVIGAGCERCTARLVRRARRRGAPEALISRTLGIAAQLCSADCLVRAVGPEVAGRARQASRAGEEALHQEQGRGEHCGCCG